MAQEQQPVDEQVEGVVGPTAASEVRRKGLIVGVAALVAGAVAKATAQPAEAGHDGSNLLHLGEINRSPLPTELGLAPGGQGPALRLVSGEGSPALLAVQQGQSQGQPPDPGPLPLDAGVVGASAKRGVIGVSGLGTAPGGLTLTADVMAGVAGLSKENLGVAGLSLVQSGVLGVSGPRSQVGGVTMTADVAGVTGLSEQSVGVSGMSLGRSGVLGVSGPRSQLGGVTMTADVAGVTGLSEQSIGVSGMSLGRSGVLGVSGPRSGLGGVTLTADMAAGVAGLSEANIGVVGVSKARTGVIGVSGARSGAGGVTVTAGLSAGVSGLSDENVGVAGVSGARVGVFGVSGPLSRGLGVTLQASGVAGISDVSIGVLGTGAVAGVHGESVGGDGVRGTATDPQGVGVRAVNGANGFALRVAGRAGFSSGGSGVIPARVANHLVAHPSVTPGSHVTVTFRGDPGRARVEWIECQAGRFIIHLQGGHRVSIPFTYLVLELAQ